MLCSVIHTASGAGLARIELGDDDESTACLGHVHIHVGLLWPVYIVLLCDVLRYTSTGYGSMNLGDIKEQVNLRSIVESYLGAPAVTSGGNIGWLCPFHDDNNPSFFLTPDRRHYVCFGCGTRGDVLDFTAEIEGIKLSEAAKRLSQEEEIPAPSAAPPPRQEAVECRVPPPEWRERATSFVKRCARKLWRENNDGLGHLRKRGILCDTIDHWQLGWLDEARRTTWGGRDVYLPRGIIIPWVVKGEVWHIKMRLFEEWDDREAPKYLRAKGGVPTLFGVDHVDGKRIAVICEGELDAILLHQEAGDLVDVVAIGPKNSTRDLEPIQGAKRWLLALDNDADDIAGRWEDSHEQVERFKPSKGNDVTDFYLAGGNLREWVQGRWIGSLSKFL